LILLEQQIIFLPVQDCKRNFHYSFELKGLRVHFKPTNRIVRRRKKYVNPIEKAKEFERQLKEENLTKNRLARKLGISRARITQLLNLLKLPQEKLDYILKYGQEKGITERSLRKEASHIIEPEENQNEI